MREVWRIPRQDGSFAADALCAHFRAALLAFAHIALRCFSLAKLPPPCFRCRDAIGSAYRPLGRDLTQSQSFQWPYVLDLGSSFP